MSDAKGIRCDRCGARTLCGLSTAGAEVPPDGWFTARVSRAQPYMQTGFLDLCPTCGEVARAALGPASMTPPEPVARLWEVEVPMRRRCSSDVANPWEHWLEHVSVATCEPDVHKAKMTACGAAIEAASIVPGAECDTDAGGVDAKLRDNPWVR